MKTYYTVDQIANMLNMHPKTIQRYIREGKLKASKVGKSWRVNGHDLSIFTEQTNAFLKNQSDITDIKTIDDKIKVSAVIDIEVMDTDEAIRIVNTLTASLNVKPIEYGKSTLSTQFIQPELKVRVMLWGNITFIQAMLSFISELNNQQQ